MVRKFHYYYTSVFSVITAWDHDSNNNLYKKFPNSMTFGLLKTLRDIWHTVNYVSFSTVFFLSQFTFYGSMSVSEPLTWHIARMDGSYLPLSEPTSFDL